MKEFLANPELRNGNNFTALYLKEIEKNENPNFNSKRLRVAWSVTSAVRVDWSETE